MKNFIIGKAKKALNKLVRMFKKGSDSRLILDVCATTAVCMIMIFASYMIMVDEMRPPMEAPVVHAYLSSNEDIQLISFNDETMSTTMTTITTLSTITTTSTTTTVTSIATTTTEEVTTTTEETTTTTVPVPKTKPKEIVTTVSYIEEEETFLPNTSGEQLFYYEEGGYNPGKGVSYTEDSKRYHEALNYITESERILLCNLVGREYGAAWVPIEEKAKVVACVMNRVHAGSAAGYRDTIAAVLTQRGQFPGYLPNNTFTFRVIPSVVDAVDYYFMHQDSFGNIKSFTGDGKYNHFR